MINKRVTAGNQQLNHPIPPLSKRPACPVGRGKGGFTIVELLVSMVMFVLVIAAASQLFTSQLTQFKQQSKIAETNIEGIIGLELLRRDIKHAGLGLPWFAVDTSGFLISFGYLEALNDPNGYNDAPSDPPRAIFSGNGAELNTSDRLIVKASNTATSATAQRWTRLGVVSVANPQGDKRSDLSGDDFVDSDRVIVIAQGSSVNDRRSLVHNGAIFSTTYNSTAAFAPGANEGVNLIYGIKPPGSPVTEPRMPFNRSDYYISTANVPLRCAPGTGDLIKNVLQQSDGNLGGGLPLLDCVADFQVTFWLDTDDDGVIDSSSNDISGLTAQEIRDEVKEVRVYILAHEGQRDTNYDFSLGGAAPPRTTWPAVDEFDSSDTLLNTVTFADLSIQIGDPDYKFYRWRLYRLAVTAENLVVEK